MTKRLTPFNILVALLLTFPIVVLAQEVATGTGPTWHGVPLMPVITLVLSILGSLFALAQRKIASANESAAKRHDTEAAFIRLAAVAFAMAGDLWTVFSAEFQQRFADGVIDADDRAAFKKLVQEKIELYTGKDELQKLAEAAGLPMAGVIAWVAEWIIDRLMKAHTPEDTTVPEGAYPVSAGDPSQGG